MNILHVIPGLSPVYGGASQAIWSMARGMLQAGHSVHIATTTADGARELDRPNNGWVEEHGVPVHYSPRQLLPWTVSLPLQSWLGEHAADYDVLHVHALFSFPSLVACRAARRARRPYVLRPLGLLDDCRLAHKGWHEAPYYALFERKNLRRAAALHATSQREALNLAQLGFERTTHVVPLSVPDPGPRASARPSGGPLELLFLGRLHVQKGLSTMLEAVGQLKSRGLRVRLTVAGDDPGGYRGVLERRSQELKLEHVVDFVGFVEGREKRELLARSDVFVLPSFEDSLGMAAAEALAAGLPVILSDRVALADDVDAAGAGLVVPPASAAALARAVTDLSDPVVRQRMAQAARALMLESFSPEREQQALEELYSAILTDGASSSHAA